MEKVAELRTTIENEIEVPYFKSDGYLLSWLEEKKFKVDKAEAGIRKTMKWRKDNNIDTILTETFDESWLPTQQKLIGHDKQHRPVLVMRTRDDDQSAEDIEAGLARAVKDKAATARYIYYQAELIRNAIIQQNADGYPMVKSCVVICDYKSVKINDYSKYMKLLFPIAQDLLKVAEDYYPGILHQCYVVNAPKKSMRLLITMLKPVINSSILDKIKIYGRKQFKWEPILHEAIPKDQLLPCYNGTFGI